MISRACDFPEKWQRYTEPDREPEVIAQLHAARSAAADAVDTIDEPRPHSDGSNRRFQMLELSAECIQAKAAFGLALHEGRRLEQKLEEPAEQRLDQTKQDEREAAVLGWCARLPAVLGAWRDAKQRHHQMLGESGFAPCVDFLSELMFEPAEYCHLEQMGPAAGETGCRVSDSLASGRLLLR